MGSLKTVPAKHSKVREFQTSGFASETHMI
jgi:hypothetical protein